MFDSSEFEAVVVVVVMVVMMGWLHLCLLNCLLLSYHMMMGINHIILYSL